MALSTQLRPAPYHIPPPRITPMSTAYPSFGYTGSSTSNFPMFASAGLHNPSRTLTSSTTAAASSGLTSSHTQYMPMCQQSPENSTLLSSGLQSPTDSSSCDPPTSPLTCSSPREIEDPETPSYNQLRSCAYNSSVLSANTNFSEATYTPSLPVAATNGYSAAQNSMLNSMFTAGPMYSPAVADYSSSFSSGSSNLWGPYPSLPTMAGPLPSTSSSVSNYKLSYDSPRYKLTPERAIPLVKWFEEHKEHPYPTRHEKILLCQSTQLTFTQVSTWFANARRRMKKANSEEEESRSSTSDDSGSQTSAESSPSNRYEEMISTTSTREKPFNV